MESYNIRITFQDTQTFLQNGGPLPIPSVHSDVHTAPTADIALHKESRRLLIEIDLAIAPSNSGELSPIDFAAMLFITLGYIHHPRAARTRKQPRLLICGESKSTKLDVSILNGDTIEIILLVQDQRSSKRADPQAQLIAGAIFVFQGNNTYRRSVELDTIESRVIPGIIMLGTSLSFFKIPVTQELARCVESGEFPPTPTVVTGHVPDIPRPNLRYSEGMKPLDNRLAFLQCCEAFKKFVV